MTYMTVANTIREQILARGIVYAGSWGARQFIGSQPAGSLGALSFRVSGRKFRGQVSVVLQPNDTYTVELWKPARGINLPKLVDQIDGVYCDNLVDVIDAKVEA